MTSLLILTNNEEGLEELGEHFDETDIRSLADANVSTGTPTRVSVDGTDISEYDAVYIDPGKKTAIYGRVLLEGIQENRVDCNLDASSFFIMAKQAYLFKVLEEKGVHIPPTVTISTEKGLSEIEKDLELPVVAKKYERFTEIDAEKLEDFDSLKSFAEHSEHGKHIIMVQEFIEGDVYDVLYVDGDTNAIKLEGDSWRLNLDDANLQYHNLSSEQQETVESAAQSIGTKICRVRLVGDTVVQVEPEPRLATFRKESGKDVYKSVASMLKGGDD